MIMSVTYLYIRSTSNLSLMQRMRLCVDQASPPLLFCISSFIWISPSRSRNTVQCKIEHGVVNTSNREGEVTPV